MPLEKQLDKAYARPLEEVWAAAKKAVTTLEGKIIQEAEMEHTFEARFKKEIHGKFLGERTQVSCSVQMQEPGSKVVIVAFPLDALERKLLFGARKGVTQTVLSWFVAHLEHHLGQ